MSRDTKRYTKVKWLSESFTEHLAIIQKKREAERGRIRQEEERTGVMEADGGSADNDTDFVFPIHCTEEHLFPVFVDRSLQSVMADPPSPSSRPALARAPPSPLSDLRLVLLGRKGAGKSAAGSTILGTGLEFGKPTEECTKRRSDVEGMKVTVIDTPGWEWYYPLNVTPDWVRRETLRSVTLCPPGPHAVLLVIRACASVNENYIKEIDEHLVPLGAQVWEHTLVLFTRGDELGLASIEQRIQASEGLQKLLSKCGNRYHMMETRHKNDGTRVKELIGKLKKIVEEKKGRYLEINDSVLVELDADASRRTRERRKRQRQMEAQAQRGTIKAALTSDSQSTSESDSHHSVPKAPRRLPEVRLVVLGERETGKSSAAGSILGRSGLFRPGTVTEECAQHQADVSGRQVTIVDTPGWDGGVMGSTPERVKREIQSGVSLCRPGPHAFLVMLRVDTAIRESQVQEHLELLGENIWRYTILIFTHCDQLREGVSIEQHIKKAGKDLQTLMDKCRGRYHTLSNSNSLQNLAELLEKVEKMAATNRCEAFSGLVQEVTKLSRQKNERHSHRLKELQDKMSRQEAELKKLRDREMKSLRWLFDWKKKSKSAGNSRKEEDANEEKPIVDKNVEDLQERMRLLIDDKEREIQDLNAEHEAMLAALLQAKRESEEAGLNAEAREREIEELNERIDEQQSKVLDLERGAVGHAQETQRRERAAQKWERAVQTLQQHVVLVEKESADSKARNNKLEKDLEQARRGYEEKVENLMQEKHIAMNDFEVRSAKYTEMLNEKGTEVEKKEKELEKLRQNEQELQNRHKKEIHEKELNFNSEMKEKVREMENRLEGVRVEHFEEIEHILKQHQNELNERTRETDISREQFAREAETKMELRRRELAALEQRLADVGKEQSLEHEKKMDAVKADCEREIEKRNLEISELREKYQEEIAREKTKMEKNWEKFEMKLKEKGNVMLTFEKRQSELEGKMFKLEKFKDQYISERNKEIEDLKCKEKDLERFLKEKGQEIEKLNLELKQKSDCMADVNAELEKKEQKILDLKTHLREVEEKLHEMESTKNQERRQVEHKWMEKEQLIQKLNEKLKDIEGMLQKKEDQRSQSLQTQRREEALQKEIQDEDMDEMKQQLFGEIEKNAQSVKLLEELTQKMTEMQNELVLKEAEIKESGRTQKKYDQEVEALKCCVQSYKEKEESDRNKKAEMSEKLSQKDKEVEQMKVKIEQTKAELKNLTEKMEKETTSLIQEYEKGIERKAEEIERVRKEKEARIKFLEQENKEKASEVAESLEKNQRKVKELEEKMTEELQKAEIKCKQLREECEAKDEQLTEKDSQYENVCKNKNQQILELGNINIQLQKERGEMKEDFEKQVAELKEKQKMEENAMKNDLAQKLKEIEMLEKERLHFEEKVCHFENKQEELAQWEVALALKQNQLEENDRERQKVVQQKERELEDLLKALEAKQLELSFHGRDLQKKVRGLKDQGMELQNKESSLRDQERELMNWTSQLEAEREHASFTTLQLDGMGKELALLRQELQRKDQRYRTVFDKLNKWEVGLQEREARLSKTQSRSDAGVEPMDQDAGEKTRKDWVRESAEFASPDGSNYQFETLNEIAEQSQSPEMQSGQDVARVKAISGFKELKNCVQNNRETGVMTILMLREAWSSRSPSGASILGGEEADVSEMNGLRFRSWRGEIAGRQVSIVEPAGLKWRDCTNTWRENILEAVTWCESVPDLVLLVMPAFLNCSESCRNSIEKQVNLVGSDTWRNTMVLFTWTETLGVSVDQHIQRSAELNKLIARCGGRYHELASGRNHSGIARLFEKMDAIVASDKRDAPR